MVLEKIVSIVQEHLFVCVDALRPSQQFFVLSGRFSVFLGWTSTKQQTRCLAQGHSTAILVSLEQATLDPQSNALSTE